MADTESAAFWLVRLRKECHPQEVGLNELLKERQATKTNPCLCQKQWPRSYPGKQGNIRGRNAKLDYEWKKDKLYQ